MSKTRSILWLLYTFFCLAGSVYGIGEKTLSIGAGASWNLLEKKQGLSESSMIRPHPVLVLTPSPGTPLPLSADSPAAENSADAFLDLRLSFDEGRPGAFVDSRGRYDAVASPDMGAAPASLSRSGGGAALFTGGESLLTLKPRNSALFAAGSQVRDFSVEFWLFSQNLENGERIFLLESSGTGGFLPRSARCTVSRNRLEWRFDDFFFAPGGAERLSLALSGPPLLPRKWTHHLVRFDADLGLLEYLVDGRLEALEYATSTGRESGEVYTPVTGENCSLTLGGRFSGMMDEFRIHRCYLAEPSLAKYPASGGRAETRAIDLGNLNSRVIKIDAFGGRTRGGPGSSENEYAGNGLLRFRDHAEMVFYLRAANSLYRWDELPWIPFEPGTELSEFRGKYIQIAVDFYPGGSGESSPYLAELALTYDASEAPRPPTGVIVAAKDGAVELSWKPSPSRDVGGYMVYYGTAGGEYFGDRAILGSKEMRSPMDVGNRTFVRIEGLTNGTLYYFAVASYARPFGDSGNAVNAGPRFLPEPGEFSREVSARPLPSAFRGDN